jgi:hypothetical protein
MEIPLEEAEGEYDLEWLRANGFEPTGTLMLGQYYETMPDNNDEIVISLVQHVDTCDTTEANMQKIETLKSSLTISASN